MDAVAAARIEEETSIRTEERPSRFEHQHRRKHRQALAARTQHVTRRGYGGYGNRKPYGGITGYDAFYYTREGHKEGNFRVKQQAERLREDRSSQRPSAKPARVSFGDLPNEFVVHYL